MMLLQDGPDHHYREHPDALAYDSLVHTHARECDFGPELRLRDHTHRKNKDAHGTWEATRLGMISINKEDKAEQKYYDNIADNANILCGRIYSDLNSKKFIWRT